MPKVVSRPAGLRPYLALGLDLDWEGKAQATANCPFCSREGSFYVNRESGLWDCKSCGAKGNLCVFFRKLWEIAEIGGVAMANLAAERGLVAETIREWGVRINPLNGEFVVPGYGADGEINLLYRYEVPPGGKKRLLLPLPDSTHQLFGVPLFDPKKPEVYVCEGPWDGMALWEAMRTLKPSDGRAERTGNASLSFLANANVLAVPGCNVFRKDWLPLFANKRVYLLYDSDHPRNNQPASGYAGMEKAAGFLAEVTETVSYLYWGPNGYDPDRPSGFDVRDWLYEKPTNVPEVFKLLRPVPTEWLEREEKVTGSKELECVDCSDWKALTNAWRKALKWTEGLDRALSVMLASVFTTKLVGEQLWIKIIGPAACGKSTLCEALSVAKKFVMAKSTMRGFHSGYQSDREGTEDNSLISKLYGKTLVTKDGDTLLQSPNLGQILSEARDLYDTTSRSHYRNKMSRDYEGVRMTWILCGTSSLRQLDSSELGERFLDCVIMESIDEELEDEILTRKALQEWTSMSYEADGKAETFQEPNLIRAKQLTGGYVNYLRTGSAAKSSRVRCGEVAMRYCRRLAKFVAFMRARPSSKQEESAERELATRLLSQIIRLALGLTVVLNRDEVDEEVMRRVKQVALDTARGRTLVIAHYLYEVGDAGMEKKSLEILTGEDGDKLTGLLRFLRRIGAVEYFRQELAKGVKTNPRWRLSDPLFRLYGEVMKDEGTL